MIDLKPVSVSGIAFLEFSGSAPQRLLDLFLKMGFTQLGRRPGTTITLHGQSDIRFICNPSAGGSAEVFRAVHGRGASAMGLKVADSAQAYARALALGAEPAAFADYPIPAIKGVGASLIYLVDEKAEATLLNQFGLQPDARAPSPNGLKRIDHLTHNLGPGGVQRMCTFYETVFGFKRIRSFHIEGKKTGLYSEVVASPCGRVIIPLNETKDDKSQIAEFLRDYNGEGIQHIALETVDICGTVDGLSAAGIPFQETPQTYFDLIDKRLPGHGESVAELRKRQILIDGGAAQGGGFLLQIFTKNSIGPIFFEFIQRKGNDGFGEGNFQALFESIELDQERRGVLI